MVNKEENLIIKLEDTNSKVYVFSDSQMDILATAIERYVDCIQEPTDEELKVWSIIVNQLDSFSKSAHQRNAAVAKIIQNIEDEKDAGELLDYLVKWHYSPHRI